MAHRFTEHLEKLGFSVTIHELEREERVGGIIAQLNCESLSLIVLMAGDGTINSALSALVSRNDHEQFTVALVPIGTANILSKELGVDSIEKSMRAIEYGAIKKLHMGRVIAKDGNVKNTSHFALMASAGFDSQVVNNVSNRLKKIIGGLAYVCEFAKLLFGGPFLELKTEVDGVTYRNILTCVSNGRYYGVKIPVTGSHVEENNFDVIIIEKMKKINLLPTLCCLFRNKDNKSIIRLTGKNNVTITADVEHCPLQIDGDYHCDLPVRVESSDMYINMYYL